MNHVARCLVAALFCLGACTRDTTVRADPPPAQPSEDVVPGAEDQPENDGRDIQEEPMPETEWDEIAARWKDLPVEDGKVVLDEEAWKERLSAEAFRVCRQAGTERAFTGRYWDSKADGVFHCVACGHGLFDARTKFDSGTGWPSFWKPLAEGAVENRTDESHGMRRTEVVCARCGSHLGHVFPDGPAPTGQRYCMNSAALLLRTR